MANESENKNEKEQATEAAQEAVTPEATEKEKQTKAEAKADTAASSEAEKSAEQAPEASKEDAKEAASDDQTAAPEASEEAAAEASAPEAKSKPNLANFITNFEKGQMKEDVPYIATGDTVVVSKTIVEGKKKRTQKFEGVVIKVQGKFSRQAITVRKLVSQIGVEKSFLVHSPLVSEIKVLKRGKVRKARLFYLRDRKGSKATRIKTKGATKG